MYEQCGAIINRVPDGVTRAELDAGDIPILAVIGEDSAQTEYDILGKTVFDLPGDTGILSGTGQALAALAII